MKRISLIISICLLHFAFWAQEADSAKTAKLILGGYCQVDYNQQLADALSYNGRLDVHRLVLGMDYNFSDRVSFTGEIEFEHVKEVEVEQAVLSYRVNAPLNFRAGLMLIPVGILNLYHEPPVFNGVERNAVATVIIPTTWRSPGMGFYGRLDRIALRYRVALVNSPVSYNGSNTFSGKYGIRKGRQHGAESIIRQPAVTGRLDYYGISGLKAAVSGFYGSSQSVLNDQLDPQNIVSTTTADSSSVGISMSCADLQYTKGRIDLNALLVYVQFNNTKRYNTFGGSDLGSAMMGYYGEIAFHIARNKKWGDDLLIFSRYAYLNTHYRVSEETMANNSYKQGLITSGVGWYPSGNSVVKVDYVLGSDAAQHRVQYINAGIGVWF